MSCCRSGRVSLRFLWRRWAFSRRCIPGSASLQVPASFLAERVGERVLLAIGTAISGVAFLLVGWSAGFLTLLTCLALGGAGASVQHPLGSSITARAYEGPRLRTALSTYNFSGDVGKAVFPVATAWLITSWDWRHATTIVGIAGLVVAVLILILLPVHVERTPAISAAEPDSAPTMPCRLISRTAVSWRFRSSASSIARRAWGSSSCCHFFLPPRAPDDDRSMSYAGVCRWRRRKIRLRRDRGAPRHHSHRHPDRVCHGAWDHRLATAHDRRWDGCTAGRWYSAQRHLVSSLRDGSRVGRARPPRPCIQESSTRARLVPVHSHRHSTGC